MLSRNIVNKTRNKLKRGVIVCQEYQLQIVYGLVLYDFLSLLTHQRSHFNMSLACQPLWNIQKPTMLQPHASHITSDTNTRCSFMLLCIHSIFHFQVNFPLLRGPYHGTAKLKCSYRTFSPEIKIAFDPLSPLLLCLNVDQWQGTTNDDLQSVFQSFVLLNNHTYYKIPAPN